MSRLRKYRTTKIQRDALSEVHLGTENLVYPMFVVSGEQKKIEIKSMPGIYQQTVDVLINEVRELIEKGVHSYMLFGIPEKKDFFGKAAADSHGPVNSSIRALKEEFGKEILIYSDVCLCEYTTHGHCGIPKENGEIENDQSLQYLADAALSYVEAGSDWVAPSNMMDNRVSSIRERLDDNGFYNTPILSYSAKFSSSYYGPFRDAVLSAPEFGDRKTYQIDYRGSSQPLMEIIEDERQGADAVIVKPALAYLDIISKARQITNLPIYAYNVSGEYSMVKFSAIQGILDEKEIVLENLFAMRRAGADNILTYHAADVVKNEWI
ncbi:MAG: porphobilinogen synthase [Candidatus Heimdallarchaeota archaeon]|nr:porphobilinogen synthase [Candidatus Heimdallarchaeota archaeon]